jgi:hypothetical protein
LAAGLEVPDSGYDLEAVVDGVAAAAALTEYLPVFEAGDNVLDAGCDGLVCPPALVTGVPPTFRTADQIESDPERMKGIG